MAPIIYTNITLILLGLAGVVLHNLVKLSQLNKQYNGKYRLIEYLKLEVYSILISVIVIFVCVLIKTEITQLEQAGKWLGLAFISIGYMGQSLLITIMGKASKIASIDESNQKND